MDKKREPLSIYFKIIIGLIVFMIVIANQDKLESSISFIMTILTPFFFGVFISYLLEPLIFKLQKAIKLKNQTISRGISISIVYVLLITIIIALGYFCIPQIISSIKELINNIPTMYDNAILFLQEHKLIEKTQTLQETLLSLTKKASEILPDLLNWVTSFFKFGFNFLITFVLAIYLSIERHKITENIKRFLNAYFKEELVTKLKTLYTDCEYIFNKYIVGKFVDSLIMAVLCFIVMKIFRLDYALLISLIFGITNLIPYIGPVFGVVIGCILLIVESPTNAIIFGIAGIILQQMDCYIIGPKILKDKVGISPLWILLSVTIGGAIGGIIGMFLGTPIFAMIAYVLNKDVNKKLEEKKSKQKEEKETNIEDKK